MEKKVFDLSVTIANYGFDPRPPEISYWSSEDSPRLYSKMIGITPDAFPNGEGLCTETLTILTHAGTHLDAPMHYGKKSDGNDAMSIDEVPLEWCYGNGVVLDFRHKLPSEAITVEDIEKELSRIGYSLQEGDIPCIMSIGGDKYLTDPNYPQLHTGITKEALEYFLSKGVKTIGTDGWSLDKPMKYMRLDLESGMENAIWPVHFAGREKPYCHIEKLANLDKLPKQFGFVLYAFPIKIMRASAGWCRPVAIYE